MTAHRSVPASLFGIVLGPVGLGDCWRVAHRAWGLPHAVGEAVMLTAFAIGAALLVLYLGQWMGQRQEAIAEWQHPVQSCFIGLAGAATALAAVAIAP